MSNAIVVRAARYRLALLLFASLALETPAPSPAQTAPADAVLGRFIVADAELASYSVPVHVDVYLRKLAKLHFALSGMQYYKRPGQVALELHGAPARFGRLFGELGTPLTWPYTYELRQLDSTVVDGRAIAHLEGVPKSPDHVTRMRVDVASDAAAPLHATWWCSDGTTIEMSMRLRTDGAYLLPDRSEIDLTVGRLPIHAVLEEGVYTVNGALPDDAFST